MDGDFVGEFEVAGVETSEDFLFAESLFREFGDVVVGIGAADLGLLGFTVGGDRSEEDGVAGDDGGGPAEAGDGGSPFDIGGFGPGVGEARIL